MEVDLGVSQGLPVSPVLIIIYLLGLFGGVHQQLP